MHAQPGGCCWQDMALLQMPRGHFLTGVTISGKTEEKTKINIMKIKQVNAK